MINYLMVEPEVFEERLLKSDLSKIQKNRSYVKKVCFLDQNGLSGFCLTRDGMLCHVFSLEKGRGRFAVRYALALGANRLSCYGDDLKSYYERFGFEVSLLEPDTKKNWMIYKKNSRLGGAVCIG